MGKEKKACNKTKRFGFGPAAAVKRSQSRCLNIYFAANSTKQDTIWVYRNRSQECLWYRRRDQEVSAGSKLIIYW